MDNIQFWLYVAFAAIYFFTRVFKKKKPEEVEQEDSNPRPSRQAPVSFEDLLKEFKGEGNQQANEEVKREQVPKAKERNKRLDEEHIEKQFEEGKTRRFADEESKRIYEESIKRAEGSDLALERDEYFKSKIQPVTYNDEDNTVAEDIREMLGDPDEAKRAIILGEILNRKY